jgi:hypothetical protein
MSDQDPLVAAALAERKFLHDVANPLATCMLIIEILSETNPDPKIAKLKKNLDSMQELIKARREILFATSAPKA